MGQQVNMEEQG